MHDIADIACNFSSDRFDTDLDEVINRAISNNITKFGLICSRLGDLDKLLSIYNVNKIQFILQITTRIRGLRQCRTSESLFNDH